MVFLVVNSETQLFFVFFCFTESQEKQANGAHLSPALLPSSILAAAGYLPAAAATIAMAAAVRGMDVCGRVNPFHSRIAACQRLDSAPAVARQCHCNGSTMPLQWLDNATAMAVSCNRPLSSGLAKKKTCLIQEAGFTFSD